MPDTHGPIEPQMFKDMNEIGIILDHALNPQLEVGGERQWGFALITFKFGEPDDSSRINYISSAPRKEMIKALEEFIERNKKTG